MNRDKDLFFIALLPPQSIRTEIDEIKSRFSTVYKSSAALKSPAHITLQPPFEWQRKKYDLLLTSLESFTSKFSPLLVTSSGFGSFKPRVIYINVLKTKELLEIYENLQIYCQKHLEIIPQKNKNLSFKPHLTVGYRDLNKTNFYRAWQEFESKNYERKFLISKLTLLKHDRKQWQIDREFNFV